jgi:hypothetical protein
MTAYDDDRVIALLHDAVPAVPDMPDRVSAVRHRAGRQRTRLMTQTLGSVVAVLLIAGVASALDGPRGASPAIRPVSDPVRVVADAFATQRSMRFDVTVHPSGAVPSLPPTYHGGLDGSITGAATADGALQVDGNLGLLSAIVLDSETGVHLRVVDGASYQSITTATQHPPAGKKWVRAEGKAGFDIADVTRLVRMAGALADSVTYVRNTVARGVPVAEYRVVVPAKYTHDTPLDLTVAIDADGLPRQIDADFDEVALFGPAMDDNTLAGLRFHVTANMFGYGDPVTITAPPAAEVITAHDLETLENQRVMSATDPFLDCMKAAQKTGNQITPAERAACDMKRPTGTTFSSGTDSGSVAYATAVPLSPQPSPTP